MKILIFIIISYVAYKVLKFIIWLFRNIKPDDIGIMDLND